MKLIIAIIKDEDNDRVSRKLTEAGFRVTFIASTGGFLRSGRSTLLIGVEDERVSEAMELLRTQCSPAKGAQEAKATVFIMQVREFEQL